MVRWYKHATVSTMGQILKIISVHNVLWWESAFFDGEISGNTDVWRVKRESERVRFEDIEI